MSGFRRVVFDTSTVVSAALRADSVPYRAVMHALGAADVCANGHTLAELNRVLKRNKFNRYLDPELRRVFAAMVRRNARLFEVREDETLAVQPECRDANDNKFLSLARYCQSRGDRQ